MTSDDRRKPGRARGVLWWALFLTLCSTPALAQTDSLACDQGCAPSDLLCVARQHLCNSRLDVYRGYMERLGQGVEMHPLPQRYLELLQPLHPEVDLAAYRFGFGDHQPRGNAITDCDRTFFGDSAFVDRLRAGDLSVDAEFEWLFHELAHVRQCHEVGGRDHYARAWFEEVGAAALRGLNPLTLHERMPMERRAVDAARRVLDGVRSSRDAEGRLAGPPDLRRRPGS